MHRVVWREFAPDESKSPSSVQSWLVLGEASDIVDALAPPAHKCAMRRSQELEAQLSGLSAHKGALNVLIAAREREAAPFLPVRVAQAVRQGASVRLWFVTRGAQSPVGAGRLDIDLAALWGAARVLSDERPDIWGGLLDLPGHDEDSADLALVARLLLIRAARIRLPFEAGGRSCRVSSAQRRFPGVSLEWRPDGAYLLTGGFGDVGLAIARAMVDEGARRLVLAGRTELPPRRTWRRSIRLPSSVDALRRFAHSRARAPRSTAGRSTSLTRRPSSASSTTMRPMVGRPSAASFILRPFSSADLIQDMKQAAFDASLRPSCAALRSWIGCCRILIASCCFRR